MKLNIKFKSLFIFLFCGVFRKENVELQVIRRCVK